MADPKITIKVEGSGLPGGGSDGQVLTRKDGKAVWGNAPKGFSGSWNDLSDKPFYEEQTAEGTMTLYPEFLPDKKGRLIVTFNNLTPDKSFDEVYEACYDRGEHVHIYFYVNGYYEFDFRVNASGESVNGRYLGGCSNVMLEHTIVGSTDRRTVATYYEWRGDKNEFFFQNYYGSIAMAGGESGSIPLSSDQDSQSYET